VPVGDGYGQTSSRQLDGLADLGDALARDLGQPVKSLWTMRNGYALCTREGLDAIARYMTRQDEGQMDLLRGKLCIGVHSDVEVTDVESPDPPHVSQAFCSALPVAYSRVPAAHWRVFASFVLEAAYEATMLAGVLNARRNRSNIVLLTRLGGGAFGNDDEWIHAAIRRALQKAAPFGLDVRLVSYAAPSPEMLQIAAEFG